MYLFRKFVGNCSTRYIIIGNVMTETVYERFDRTKNFETGEITEEQSVSISRKKVEPVFVKLYLKDILYIQNVPNGLHDILYELLQYMTRDNMIIINGYAKEIISKKLGCSVHRIDKALSTFHKRNILIRQKIGAYLANPYIFGRDKWENVKKIRASITWSPEGKKLSSLIETENE